MATQDNNENEETTSAETEQDTNTGEKKFTQEDVNKLLAKEKRTWQTKFDSLQNEFTTFKTDVESKEQAQETKLKTQVDELRKGVPEQVTKLLDKLTISEQYEYLTDANNKFEKQKLPDNPKEKGDGNARIDLVKIKF